jgi:hypothetical protein
MLSAGPDSSVTYCNPQMHAIFNFILLVESIIESVLQVGALAQALRDGH